MAHNGVCHVLDMDRVEQHLRDQQGGRHFLGAGSRCRASGVLCPPLLRPPPPSEVVVPSALSPSKPLGLYARRRSSCACVGYSPRARKLTIASDKAAPPAQLALRRRSASTPLPAHRYRQPRRAATPQSGDRVAEAVRGCRAKV
jgi:hypothetical protein